MKPVHRLSLALAAVVALVAGLLPGTALAAPSPQDPPGRVAPPVATSKKQLSRVQALPDAAADQARLASGKVVQVAEVRIDTPAAVVGATWTLGAQNPDVLYRTLKAGRPSDWRTAEVEDASVGENSRTAGTQPVIVTDADTVQFATLSDAPLDAELSAFSSYTDTDAAVASSPGTRVGAAGAFDNLRPAMKGRGDWGSNEAIVTLPFEYGIVSGGMLHHTAGSNSYTQADVPGILRSIQAYHVNGRGWKDIAYNVLVDKFGTAWEGRGGGVHLAVSGGHALGETNMRVFGVSLMGDYQTVQPSAAMLSKAEDVLAWKFALNGVDPYGSTWGSGGQDGGSTFLNAISGHRDENATDCPGQYVYAKMGEIRAAVKSRLSGVSYPIVQPQPTPVYQLPTPDPVTGKVTLEVNGHLDKGLVVELQKWVGVTTDGAWGSGTNSALQAKLGVPVTGVRDSTTIRALQAKVGATQTAYMDTQTVTAMQTFLNNLFRPVYAATPIANDACATASDTYRIPASAGVEYLVGGVVKPTGTYTAAGVASLVVTARALPGFSLLGPSTWTLVFTDTPCTATNPAGSFTSVAPCRVLDTREAIGVPSRTQVPANGEITVKVVNRCALPQNGVGAVAMNVTVTNPGGSGFITVFPAGQAAPEVSNLNFVANQTIPNMVVVKTGATGEVVFRNASARPVDLIADMAGWTTAGAGANAGAYNALAPLRILDTRTGNGAQQAAVAPNGVVELQVTGAGGVPVTGVGAVVLNLTATEPTAGGWLTAYPSGTTAPDASTVNFVARQSIPNLAVVKVGANGRVAIKNSSGGTVHILADVAGWVTGGTPTTSDTIASLAPVRILDTRSGNGAPKAAVGPGGVVGLKVTGRGGVPDTGVSAVIMNVTVTDTMSNGWITVFPSGTAEPNASNLNFVRYQSIPNLVMVKVGPDGVVKLANNSPGTVNLLADVAGYVRS